MKILSIVSVSLSILSCAIIFDTSEPAWERIHLGQTANVVLEILGEPDGWGGFYHEWGFHFTLLGHIVITKGISVEYSGCENNSTRENNCNPDQPIVSNIRTFWGVFDTFWVGRLGGGIDV